MDLAEKENYQQYLDYFNKQYANQKRKTFRILDSHLRFDSKNQAVEVLNILKNQSDIAKKEYELNVMYANPNTDLFGKGFYIEIRKVVKKG